jgi:hypothetical protein
MKTKEDKKLWMRKSHVLALTELIQRLEKAGFKNTYAYDQEGEPTEKNPSILDALHQVSCAELGALDLQHKDRWVFCLQIITFNDDVIDNVPDWSWHAECPQSIQDDFTAVMDSWYDDHENY